MTQIKNTNIRNSLMVFVLSLAFYNSSAQDARANILSLLTDNHGAYTANDEAKVSVSEDGNLRISRIYESGDKKFVAIINGGIVPDKEKLESNRDYVQGTMDQLRDMGLNVDEINDDTQFGYLTIYESDAQAFVIIRDKFLIEFSVSGAQDINEIRDVYEQLDLSKLK